jgi:hypothetical protein
VGWWIALQFASREKARQCRADGLEIGLSSFAFGRSSGSARWRSLGRPSCVADRLFLKMPLLQASILMSGRMIVTVRLFTRYDRNDFTKTEITP